MVRATPDEEDAFSVQLYGVDPATVGRAVEMLVDEGVAGTRPAHVDLNFGCPVPKVTRKGGDRKSTRLNSSHANISYAVFCLKKKNMTTSKPVSYHITPLSVNSS